MEKEIEIKSIIVRVKMQLSGFFDGNSWVTENFNKKVLSIDTETALKKMTGHNHSVAQLVAHMMAWRNFAVQKLTGNDSYDIEDNSTVNWPETADWPALCRQYMICHNKLLAAIDNLPVERWNTKVPGRNYVFTYLVEGIIQHDYYHYGQAGAVLAAIKNNSI